MTGKERVIKVLREYDLCLGAEEWLRAQPGDIIDRAPRDYLVWFIHRIMPRVLVSRCVPAKPVSMTDRMLIVHFREGWRQTSYWFDTDDLRAFLRENEADIARWFDRYDLGDK